ncbi:MAG TPA: DUF1330 domain-containing protein [Hyphomonadaceae bacterium]|nr:DUF1330 domain-containing protein [Hyphomonadaceae bacterium]
MPVYTIAQLKFTDIGAYRRYQNAFPTVFAKFNAKVLVADESPRVLEGDWPRDKVVILAFPDEAEAKRFAMSPEYQEIAKDRKAGADAVVLMVKGFEPKA